MSIAIVNTGVKVRNMVLHTAESIPEEFYDIQAAAFNNTIRWNLGHIVVSLHSLLSMAISFDSKIPASYASLFGSGSKPAQGDSTAPSKDELIQYLRQQLTAISEITAESFNDPLKAPLQLGPMTFNTVGDLVNFVFIHETIHYTTMNCIQKVIRQES